MEYRFENCAPPWRNPLKGLPLRKFNCKPITHTHAYMHKIPSGTIEVTVMELDTAKLWWYEIEANRRCLLSIYHYNSEFSLYFSLKNGTFAPFEAHPILAYERNVVLIYMSNINYDISLLSGKYVFYQINYNKRDWAMCTKNMSILGYLHTGRNDPHVHPYHCRHPDSNGNSQKFDYRGRRRKLLLKNVMPEFDDGPPE